MIELKSGVILQDWITWIVNLSLDMNIEPGKWCWLLIIIIMIIDTQFVWFAAINNKQQTTINENFIFAYL